LLLWARNGAITVSILLLKLNLRADIVNPALKSIEKTMIIRLWLKKRAERYGKRVLIGMVGLVSSVERPIL